MLMHPEHTALDACNCYVKVMRHRNFGYILCFVPAASKSLMKNDNLTEEACDILLKRGLRPVEGGKFVFTRDFKLYNKSLYSFADDVTAEFARQVKCPHLIILASKSLDYFASEKDFIDLYRSSNPGFRLDQVEGGHHFHLTNPEVAAPLIHNFLGQSSSV